MISHEISNMNLWFKKKQKKIPETAEKSGQTGKNMAADITLNLAWVNNMTRELEYTVYSCPLR